LRLIEHSWFHARHAVAGRRRDSHAAAAIDLLAAAPLLSATSLAQLLGIAIKNAIRLLDGFVVQGLASEMTHRSKRRLYGLTHLAPLRAATTAPRRPQPRRPRAAPIDDREQGSGEVAPILPPSPPLPCLRLPDESSTSANSTGCSIGPIKPSAAPRPCSNSTVNTPSRQNSPRAITQNNYSEQFRRPPARHPQAKAAPQPSRFFTVMSNSAGTASSTVGQARSHPSNGTVNLGSAYRSKAHQAERCSAIRMIMQPWGRR
jgi:hypothetical protein